MRRGGTARRTSLIGIALALTCVSGCGRGRSLAVTATDLDSLFGYAFVHWVVYDIPASDRELPAGFAGQRPGSRRIERGRNDGDHDGYVPPCPPGGGIHRYGFVVYALDTMVSTPGLSKARLLTAIRGHVLAKGELIGRARR